MFCLGLNLKSSAPVFKVCTCQLSLKRCSNSSGRWVQRKGLSRTGLELISVVVGDLEQCTSNTGWQEEMSACRCCTDTCVAACCLDPIEKPGRADVCKQPVQLIGGRGPKP